MAGLDPAIHLFARDHFERMMDHRGKPGDDSSESVESIA
jgi:hypothetical protein